MTVPTVDDRQPRYAATLALYAGLALTVLATALPALDRSLLTEHIQAGYPSYSASETDAAATTYVVILATVGVLGVLAWVANIWLVRSGSRAAPYVATTTLVVGVGVALTGLLTEDTSGDVGLAPLVGWVGLLPSLAGATAVVLLWRARRRLP